MEQDEKIQKKFLLAFDKTQAGNKGSWFEKLKSSDGIYEFRQSDHQKFYRVFAFWDSAERQTLVIGTHGFNKKSDKTPLKEIKRAEQIKKRYFRLKTRTNEDNKFRRTEGQNTWKSRNAKTG
ncbi:MAG: type II toxin-antitoxin system RelE/ParE family toxin [Saprospiraceae bacterium]|nr:type II toxin-antitoxin system RelE/ParE family toxin [Saprospiraceae bacterium]